MQTLLVTGVALLAAAYLTRRFLAGLRARPTKGGGCGGCDGCANGRDGN